MQDLQFLLLAMIASVACFSAGCALMPAQQEVVEGYVTSDDGVRLFYRSVGEGNEVLVIPIAVYLQDILKPLSTSRRVIFYDPRNRGGSGNADLTTITLRRQVSDLEVLRRGLNIDQMALLGWSGLGMEVVVYALSYPQYVTRVIQVSAIPPAAALTVEYGDARDDAIDQTAIDDLNRRAAAGDFDGKMEEFCRQYYALTLPANFVNSRLVEKVPDGCEHPNEWPSNLFPYFDALYLSYGDYDLRDDIKHLSIPRLVIHGREDGVHIAGAYAWASGNSEARVVELSPSGHFPFIEQPAKFFDAVETFLNGSWPNGAVAVSD